MMRASWKGDRSFVGTVERRPRPRLRFEHRREVFERFEGELARDRARTRILQFSEFGLIEVTPKRSRGNLERVLTAPCPDCGGSGRVKSDLTVALDLRRALLRPPSLYKAGEILRVRVRPSLARLLEDEEQILPEVEGSAGSENRSVSGRDTPTRPVLDPVRHLKSIT